MVVVGGVGIEAAANPASSTQEAKFGMIIFYVGSFAQVNSFIGNAPGEVASLSPCHMA
jgi:hypothetical protein